MTKKEMIQLLNADLANEMMHMMFYLHSAAMVQGLHAAEYKELFEEEAKEEMSHVREFSDMIIGLQNAWEMPVSISSSSPAFPTEYSTVPEILNFALRMEQQVVQNYVSRIEDSAKIGGVDGKWIEIFLEEQIMKSRKDIDKIRQWMKP